MQSNFSHMKFGKFIWVAQDNSTMNWNTPSSATAGKYS